MVPRRDPVGNNNALAMTCCGFILVCKRRLASIFSSPSPQEISSPDILPWRRRNAPRGKSSPAKGTLGLPLPRSRHSKVTDLEYMNKGVTPASGCSLSIGSYHGSNHVEPTTYCVGCVGASPRGETSGLWCVRSGLSR